MGQEYTKEDGDESGSLHGNHRGGRLYIRVTTAEKAALRGLAEAGGFVSMSAYMREKGLSSGITPTEASSQHWQWLGAINRIGTEMDGIAAQLAHGREPDEEILLLIMQLHELAQETWHEAQATNEQRVRSN